MFFSSAGSRLCMIVLKLPNVTVPTDRPTDRPTGVFAMYNTDVGWVEVG